MANTQAMCTSFKVDLFNGVHNFGTAPTRATTAADTFNAALYYATATLNSTTTVYSSAAGEVSGGSYPTGGVAITSFVTPSSTGGAGTTAYTTPTFSIVYTGVTIGTAFDAVLIYNVTQGNKAVSVHTFGSQTVTAGNFTLVMPTNAAGTALLNLA
jgi:hypothetical protein